MNLGKENEIVEFKESTAEFDRACKAIVAMLNKSGMGTIYFGVKDNGEVIGHLIGKDTLSTLADRIKESIKPSIYPVIKSETLDGKTIIKVIFQGSNKPYAYKGAFYIRVEQQNLVMDPIVLRDMIKASDEYNDLIEKELTPFDIEHIDEEALDRFYRQAVAQGRIEKHDHTSSELLTQLGLMRDDRLTNAGYYLFGKDVFLVYKAVEYPSTERLNPIDLKRFEDNIFNLIQKVSGFIQEKIKWRVEFNGMKREEIPEIPLVAIREIVINSLVHSDFHGETEHQVTIDPEVIEIYNPGSFGDYTPMDYVNNSLPSRTRHKMIQNILFKAYDIETLGRGLKRTDKACKDKNVAWDYRKFPDGFSFCFLRNNSNTPLSVLSKKASILLDYMKSNDDRLDNLQEACLILGLKPDGVYPYITELITAKKIERIGSRKSGYWKLK